MEGRRRRGGGSPTEASEEEEASSSHQEEGEWVRMSGNILELEQLRDSRELSASQLHLLLHPTQVGWETRTYTMPLSSNSNHSDIFHSKIERNPIGIILQR